MKLQEVTAYNLKSQQILNESWQTLTETQRIYLGRWERELWPLVEQYVKLCEATLTADQVQQIFQSAEEVAAQGNNRTALGKAGDLAKKAGAGAVAAGKMSADLAKQVNDKINELGRLAQKSGPVKNLDDKFDQLKNTINKKFPDSKILDGISEIGIWAQNNPGKASLAIGILTTIAALAGGPAGGAAAAFILRSSKELMTGAKLSSAIGKSVKTAAYGAIAGWALEGIGDWLEGIRAEAVPYEKVPGLTQIDVGLTRSFSAPGFSLQETLGSMVVPENQAQEFMQLVNTAKGGDVNAFNQLWQFTKNFDIQQAAQDIQMNNQVLKELAIQNDEFLKNLTMANDAIAAVAQGTVAGKMDANDIKVDNKPIEPEAAPEEDDNPNIVRGNESLSMEERYELYLQEGPLGDKLKQAGSAIKSKAAEVGKNLTNKVTASKLMQQWKAMKEPGDTGSIINILQDAGLSTEQVGQIGQASGIDLGAGASTKQTDEPAQQVDQAPTDAASSNRNFDKVYGVPLTPQGAAARAKQPPNDDIKDGEARAKAAGYTVDPKTGVWSPPPDLKTLADEIKQAGPQVVSAVKTLLTTPAA
jgi:hypothetical protein